MTSKTTIDLDKVREFRLDCAKCNYSFDSDGWPQFESVECSPRDILSLLTKDEIIEYLIQTGILHEKEELHTTRH